MPANCLNHLLFTGIFFACIELKTLLYNFAYSRIKKDPTHPKVKVGKTKNHPSDYETHALSSIFNWLKDEWASIYCK
jgi:hypothetical protein